MFCSCFTSSLFFSVLSARLASLPRNGEFNVPIVNVSVSPTAPAQGQDESSAPPTTAARAFGKIVNSMYKRKKAKQQQQQQQQQPV